MEEDIKILKEKLETIENLCIDDCINKSVVIEPLKYAIKNILNRLEQYERVIQEMESKLKEIQDEYLDFCPDCVDLANDLLKIIEHFRKKCE